MPEWWDLDKGQAGSSYSSLEFHSPKHLVIQKLKTLKLAAEDVQQAANNRAKDYQAELVDIASQGQFSNINEQIEYYEDLAKNLRAYRAQLRSRMDKILSEWHAVHNVVNELGVDVSLLLVGH